MKNKKGISLIVLVTTIIVAIILVGVTIANISKDENITMGALELAFKQKILNYKERLNEHLNKEESKSFENGQYFNFNKYNKTVEETNEIIKVEEKDKNNFKIESGKLVLVDNAYTEGSQEMTWAEELGIGSASISISQVNAGDYIVGYSAGPAGMVYGDDEEAEKWRVLWNTDTSGNTKLEIRPTKSVRDVTLGSNDPKAPVEKQDGGFEQGKWSYLNVIKTINEYSEDYINSVYADSARGLGSNRANPTNKEVVDFTISSSMSFPVADTEDNTQTFYEADIDQLQDVVGITGFGNAIVWVSSRSVYSSSSYASFSVRFLNTSGVVYGDSLCSVNRNGNEYGYGHTCCLVPAVSLKSDIRLEDTGEEIEGKKVYRVIN